MSEDNERINASDGLFCEDPGTVGMNSVGEETPLLSVRNRGKIEEKQAQA